VLLLHSTACFVGGLACVRVHHCKDSRQNHTQQHRRCPHNLSRHCCCCCCCCSHCCFQGLALRSGEPRDIELLTPLLLLLPLLFQGLALRNGEPCDNELLTQLLLLLLLLFQGLALRYGEPRDIELLTQLAGSLSASLSPHWLGLIDLDGSMGLQQLMQQLAVANSSGSDGDGGGGSQKCKVEMDLSQLGQLQ
jgi:hypothetical protein